ncbi:MAG: hypothetical protein A2527_06765 [Candidatus Lambdaproteobacteria bacterium RIFOXYD2_FULL_50_16]|uniref:Uncharacterized protein n=1 Tax=Candidatus Lambdaproteobacteria bacterium RIFOXYD2_FULL_50_16 TaxID=1817772 RepID=A0A1F6GBQ4_9PROT|nr:MAG: hypothetical protein A2527_06765 [Candidatus Lambdaproteobacteria bacterium RIFOXYD2_FULL_50_16]
MDKKLRKTYSAQSTFAKKMGEALFGKIIRYPMNLLYIAINWPILQIRLRFLVRCALIKFNQKVY